ncbi:ABC-type transport system involved in multi-copper enzyme maturation permease subunit [Saccharothrix tamanrassetensis]|uniref:ABC-type transport system involved in multi-copper enzyme maturation permease subunit n=1 Tax=Saccharothrix tamanrassetensis TaxID=1051531 RepID=A0A841CM48_9PSEU|nr:ABC transporter permease [Saccharothrix tamanrassetensis]MBB5957228.1 ABC-type transport system involved in multi-copper enzyme maturation permease subunit [Saccharothrix tamanrassetensis]
MNDALRFEWVRIRTLPSTWWLIASALLLGLAMALSVAVATHDEPRGHEVVGVVLTGGGANVPVPLIAVFLAVIGIFATGHEYRYGTIQPTLTTVPRRSTLLTAKLVVLAATALVVGLVSLLLNVVVALLVWGDLPGLTDWPLNEVLPGHVVLVLLWTVLGAALGQLFRGVPSALVVILVVPLVVEQLIFSLSFVPMLDWLAPVVAFLPFTAGQQLVHLGGVVYGQFFDRWVSGGVFAAFVGIVLAVAWTRFNRRDA